MPDEDIKTVAEMIVRDVEALILQLRTMINNHYPQVSSYNKEEKKTLLAYVLNELIDIPILPESVEQPIFKWLANKVFQFEI